MNYVRPAMVLCLLILPLAASRVQGGIMNGQTGPQPRPRADVYSRNRAFVLDVNPASNLNTVYHANDRSRPIWSFPGVLKSDVKEVLLADSGKVVALILSPEPNGDNPADNDGIRLLAENGSTRSYRIGEFVERPPTSFSCGGNGVFWVVAVNDHGDGFQIEDVEGRQHTIPYETGSRLRRGWMTTAAIGGAGLVMVVILIRLLSRRPAPVLVGGEVA